jgi:hypothetical protein
MVAGTAASAGGAGAAAVIPAATATTATSDASVFRSESTLLLLMGQVPADIPP